MKKLCVILLIVVMCCGLFSCQEPTQQEPNYVYSYEVGKVESIRELIDSPIVFPDTDRFASCEELFFVKDAPRGTMDIKVVDFLGEKQGLSYIDTKESFPAYPMGVGPFSTYTYFNSRNDRGTVFIRHETKKPIYMHGCKETLFQELDFEDRDAVVAFATDLLKRYTSFEGYTLFVYEDKVRTLDGIVVEYNLTVDGQKTNCFVKLGIGYNRIDYEMKITNDIEASIKPYLDAKVNVEQLEQISKYYLNTYSQNPNFRLEKHEILTELMVLNGTLVAYITIKPIEMRLTEAGVAFYGNIGQVYKEAPIPGQSTFVLVEIASLSYETK